jgi:hypothetical protein
VVGAPRLYLRIPQAPPDATHGTGGFWSPVNVQNPPKCAENVCSTGYRTVRTRLAQPSTRGCTAPQPILAQIAEASVRTIFEETRQQLARPHAAAPQPVDEVVLDRCLVVQARPPEVVVRVPVRPADVILRDSLDVTAFYVAGWSPRHQ